MEDSDELQLVEESELLDDQESGQGMVEYAFILVLIVLVLILIVTVVGKQTNNLYSNIQNGLNAATGP